MTEGHKGLTERNFRATREFVDRQDTIRMYLGPKGTLALLVEYDRGHGIDCWDLFLPADETNRTDATFTALDSFLKAKE